MESFRPAADTSRLLEEAKKRTGLSKGALINLCVRFHLSGDHRKVQALALSIAESGNAQR